MKRYEKAHKGQNLSLTVGGGTRTIADDEILEGPYWQKFADQGLLRELPDEPQQANSKAKPKKVAPAFAPAPVEPLPSSDGTPTKSPADKFANAMPAPAKPKAESPKKEEAQKPDTKKAAAKKPAAKKAASKKSAKKAPKKKKK